MATAAVRTALSEAPPPEPVPTREELIVSHLPLVKAIANRVRESLPVQVELDDLVHAGIMGLFDAVAKFDPEKQVLFRLYAKHRIRGAILDSLRQLDWASRDLRKRFKLIEAATQQLCQTLGRTPTELEVAEALEMTPGQFRKLSMELYNSGLGNSQPHRVEKPDHTTLDESAESPEQRPDEVFALHELREALDEAIATLPERYQRVIRLYYHRDRTMKQIGAVLGVNESRVSQIHKTALERLESALRASGYESATVFLQEERRN